MLPLRAASIEKGSAGLDCENDGGSTRRKGELEARRFERRPTRLFFGEPRLWLMGVEVLVLGDEIALRTEGAAGEAVTGRLSFEDGDVIKEKLTGLENPSIVLDFLVGELKMEGSTFSESSSSNTAAARRLPVEGWVGLREDEKEGVRAFCLFLALESAWSRGVPISAKGWRVKRAMVLASVYNEEGVRIAHVRWLESRRE